MNLQDFLPPELRGPDTTVEPIAVGFSGDGVYRVRAGGHDLVLKLSGQDQPAAEWRRKLRIQQLASDAGLAPRIVHVDEAGRAVVSVFVADRSLPTFYFNPQTHDQAVRMLGRTVRRVHDLPLPAAEAGAPHASHPRPADPRAFLADTWARVDGFALPRYVGDVVRHTLAEEPPVLGERLVLSHNDLNPTNLVFDGEGIVLLDWETAAPNDPCYDLAVLALFLRMDEPTCLRLLSAYEDGPVDRLPGAFPYFRRLAPLLVGTTFLGLARDTGSPGAAEDETPDSTPSLGEVYQRMRSGEVDIASAEGKLRFGLALVKEAMVGETAPAR